MQHFSDSFCVYQLRKYSESLAKQDQFQKKIYAVDTGLVVAENFAMSRNDGYLMENMICNELLKRNKNIFYLKNGFECDFVVCDGLEATEIIQVCFDLNSMNEKREYKGLLSAAKLLNLNRGTLITDNREDSIIVDGVEISIVPAWKWMLIK